MAISMDVPLVTQAEDEVLIGLTNRRSLFLQ